MITQEHLLREAKLRYQYAQETYIGYLKAIEEARQEKTALSRRIHCNEYYEELEKHYRDLALDLKKSYCVEMEFIQHLLKEYFDYNYEISILKESVE